MRGIRSIATAGLAAVVLACAGAPAWPDTPPVLPAPRPAPPPLLLGPDPFDETGAAEPNPVLADSVAACAAVADPSACILDVIGKARPEIREAAALAPLPTFLEVRALGTRAGDFLPAYVKAIRAPRLGGGTAGGPDASPTGQLILVRLCADGAREQDTEIGPHVVAWADKVRPSPALRAAAADAVEALVKKDERLSYLTFALVACRASLGDMRGLDRALAKAPAAQAWSWRMEALEAAGRFDDAFALAAKPPADPAVEPDRERERLMRRAAAAGRLDIADRTAMLLLEAGPSSDEPDLAFGSTGVAAALGWLTGRPNPGQAPAWLLRTDARVRPGQPGWNPDDAVAVYRAWRALGSPDRRTSIYAATLLEAASPPPDLPSDKPPGRDATPEARKVWRKALMTDAAWRRASIAVGQMLAADGRWEEARALGVSARDVFEEDRTMGMAAALFQDRLSHADPSSERTALLQACVRSGQTGAGRTLTPVVPLDTAAFCVRNLATALPDPVRPRAPFSDQLGISLAALDVADRAARMERLDVVRDMVSLALQSWRKPEAAHGPLSLTTIMLLARVSATDLHLRGKPI